MLFGEHAVLHGMPAVVAAVDKRMRVTRKPRPIGVEIWSALGHYEADGPPETWPDDSNFRFLLEVFRRHAPHAGTDGVGLEITSEFSSTVGFGSSSAVTVGALAVLTDLEGAALHAEALSVVRAVQGRGSGSDVAASVFGGIVAYSLNPVSIERLDAPFPEITAVYSGHKTPTAEVIRIVNERREAEPEIIAAGLRKVGAIAGSSIKALEAGDWDEVGDLMNMHQSVADLLGINTPALREITATLRGTDGMFGAKISGAGLGDCAIGLGRADGTVPSYETLPVAIGRDGVIREFES